MSDTIISVEGLGKRYELGELISFKQALRSLKRNWRTPWRALQADETDSDKFMWALKDVSLEVNRGEVVGLIGGNGAGKSTLLKILSRITAPTVGRARIKGHVGSLLEVGTGFHPELTGRENIYLNGSILGMRKADIKRNLDAIIDFAGIDRHIDTPVKRYSSGMGTRLAFSVAAHLNAEVMIIDEVLAVGDAGFQAKCLGKMDDASRSGRTILFVSHNMGAIRRLCSRAVVLHHGQVAYAGDVGEAISRYLNDVLGLVSSDDLGTVPREKNCTPVFQAFRALPGEGASAITPGKPAVFEIDCNFPRDIPNATVGIHLCPEAGMRALCFNTRWELGPLEIKGGRRTVRCRVDDLPLKPGRYVVDLGMSSGGHQFDHIEGAAFLTVDYDRYFPTGEFPYDNQGYAVCRSSWEL